MSPERWSVDLVDRHRVTVTGNPDGQPVMFVHGFGCDQTMWRHVWPAFRDDHRIVLFDQAGASEVDASTFDFERHETLTGYAHDIVALCEELDVRDAILIGHSVGAMIGALACIAAPERFEALVMVSPSPRYLDDEGYVGGFSRAEIDGLLETMDRNYLGWSSAMAGVVAADPDSEVAEELENSFCRMDPRIARHFAQVTFLSDNRADLSAVPVPCLVLQSTEDSIASVEVGRYVDAQLPDSRLVMIDTVGHCPHLSAPEATVAAIRGFV